MKKLLRKGVSSHATPPPPDSCSDASKSRWGQASWLNISSAASSPGHFCGASARPLRKLSSFPVVLSCPNHPCNPKVKTDWSSRSQLHQQLPWPCLYGAIDSRNFCPIVAPHLQAPSTFRQPYLGGSHEDRGHVCVCVQANIPLSNLYFTFL